MHQNFCKQKNIPSFTTKNAQQKPTSFKSGGAEGNIENKIYTSLFFL